MQWTQIHLNIKQETCSLGQLVVWHQPVHFSSGVGEDYGKAEVGPLFSGLWIHFLHQASQLLQSSIHPENKTQMLPEQGALPPFY